MRFFRNYALGAELCDFSFTHNSGKAQSNVMNASLLAEVCRDDVVRYMLARLFVSFCYVFVDKG